MNSSSVQQRTQTKRTTPKKKNPNNNNNIKPMKVVYISNPMKVKTSASEFRALVQELTGQDAESPPDPSRFQELGFQESGGNDGGGCDKEGYNKMISDKWFVKIGHDDGDEKDQARVVTPQVDPNNNYYCQGQGELLQASGSSSMESFEPFDDVFTPQMIESITAMMPDSVLYESSQVDSQCNYVHQ
ncbi:hypothetical protein RIF29_05459 [Crotalaria pallida]|uniref:VQ domain-containing protein n=1 Tax=Crotalaria pallida TaxID=3830 RepID=A0AAN9P9S1_CROPI